MIIFAIMASVSVVDLFKAGIGPSLVLITLLGGYTLFKGPKDQKLGFDFKKVIIEFKLGILSLLMPVFILGGIYSGFFTATESAAMAVVYALVVEFFIHREFKLHQLYEALIETAEMLGLLFLILITATSLNKYMTFEGIPQMMVDYLSTFINSKTTFIIFVNILLLIVGSFMDVMSAILVLAPILTPMSIHYGMDPVHFGIMMIVNLEIGYLTPPIGINLFVASGIFKEPLGLVIKSVIPYIFVMLIGLIIISFFPGISLMMMD
jgi:C4-dicarboxylate transporter DctM subunit